MAWVHMSKDGLDVSTTVGLGDPVEFGGHCEKTGKSAPGCGCLLQSIISRHGPMSGLSDSRIVSPQCD